MPFQSISSSIAFSRRDLGMAAFAAGAGALMKPTTAAAQGPVIRALKDLEGDAVAELA